MIGTPDLVIALDSGAGDYELWSTTSYGLVNCTVDVQVLTESAHSGIASGIVPSSMHHAAVADRLEDRHRRRRHPNCMPKFRFSGWNIRKRRLRYGLSLLDSFSAVPTLHPVSDDPPTT